MSLKAEKARKISDEISNKKLNWKDKFSNNTIYFIDNLIDLSCRSGNDSCVVKCLLPSEFDDVRDFPIYKEIYKYYSDLGYKVFSNISIMDECTDIIVITWKLLDKDTTY